MPVKKYSERKREQRDAANSEAAGVILIIISAFLLLCMLTRGLILGDIGRAIANVFMGVIGYVTYPLLLFMLILGILKVQKRKLSVRVRYAVWISVIAFAVILIAQLATSHSYLGNGFNSYVSDVYANKNTVGGVLFGVIDYAFYAVVGTVFAYIIFSLLIVAALFFMSGFYTNLPVVKRADKRRKNKMVKKSSKGFVTEASYDANGFFDSENRAGGHRDADRYPHTQKLQELCGRDLSVRTGAERALRQKRAGQDQLRRGAVLPVHGHFFPHQKGQATHPRGGRARPHLCRRPHPLRLRHHRGGHL